MKVKNVMTKNPISMELPGSRDELLRTLVKNNKTGMPILKKDGIVAGLVTRQDIFVNPEETQISLLMQKDPVVIETDVDVTEAAKMMLSKKTYHLSIVEENKLVGIVTPTDLLKVVEKRNIDTPVEQFIRQPCVALYEETPLNVAVTIMRLSDIYALPVLNENARLSGIISDRDIFNMTMVDGSVAVSDLGLGDDEDDWTWEGLRNVMKLYYEVSKVTLPSKNVKEIMVKKPDSIFKKTSVSDAAKLMLRNDYGQLPIRNAADRLEAMVYDIDLVAALL